MRMTEGVPDRGNESEFVLRQFRTTTRSTRGTSVRALPASRQRCASAQFGNTLRAKPGEGIFFVFEHLYGQAEVGGNHHAESFGIDELRPRHDDDPQSAIGGLAHWRTMRMRSTTEGESKAASRTSSSRCGWPFTTVSRMSRAMLSTARSNTRSVDCSRATGTSSMSSSRSESWSMERGMEYLLSGITGA